MNNNIGGMTSYFNSFVNLYNSAGELRSLSSVGSDATHEMLHTLRLDHPFEITQTADTELLRVAPNSFVSTPTTDKNIVNNIMNYPIITIDGQKGSNLNSLTKGQLNFMLKEIEEQPNVIEKTLEVYTNYDGKVDFSSSLKELDLSKIEEIYIVACGTAYHAGLQGAYFFKKISGIKTDVDIASEFRYSDPFIDEKSLVIFISQSGETLDTIMAMKMAKSKGAKTLAITNVLGSTISREVDMVIYTLAGPEISVASTKAYTAQVTLFYLLALYFGERKRSITSNFYNSYLDILHKLSNEVEKVIENKENVREVAKKIKNKMNGFFIGRGIDDKCAREGSLKMKEITYIHTEAFSAGELKHGTIALIEEGTMVVAIATQEDMLEKMISNIKEVKARGAYVITLTKEKYKNVAEISDEIITIENIEDILAPTVANIVLQLLAYYTAVEKGLDVDKPRNLAKSVTVE